MAGDDETNADAAAADAPEEETKAEDEGEATETAAGAPEAAAGATEVETGAENGEAAAAPTTKDDSEDVKKEESTPEESKDVDMEDAEKESKEEVKAEERDEGEPKDGAGDEAEDEAEDDEPVQEETKECSNEETEDDSKEKVKKKPGRKRKADTPAVEPKLTPSKRGRKPTPTKSFQPTDFSKSKRKVNIIHGRGLKIREIPSVKDTIESYSTTCDEMALAHRLLFPMRGKVAKHGLKANILEFSGYLAHLPENFDKEKFEKEDDEAEKKYSTRTFKLTLAEVKSLCAFFNVKTEGTGGKKDTLIDALLDFLGAPDPELVHPEAKVTKDEMVSSAKKAGKPKKAKETPSEDDADDAADDNVEEDEATGGTGGGFELVRKVSEGEVPSEKALRQWVRAYVVCFDMDKVTTKHAITTASEKFGVDVSSQKDLIKELLAQMM